MKLLICNKRALVQDQELIPGVAETISRYKQDGWELAIASNQDSVATDAKTLGAMIDEMFFVMSLAGINYAIAAIPYKTEFSEASFFCTKDGGIFWKPIASRLLRFRMPDAGMIKYLLSYIFDNNSSDEKALFVGNHHEDQQAAQTAGVDFMWASEWVK